MTAPGWYPDPQGQQRYWDGQQWGATPPPPAPPPPKKPLSKRDRNLLIALGGAVVGVGFGAFAFQSLEDSGSSGSSTSTRTSSMFTTSAQAAPPSKTQLTDVLSPSEIEDAQFMAAIMANDIPFGNREDILATGKGVCAYLSRPGTKVGVLLGDLIIENPQLSPEQVGIVARAAMDVWCPDKVPEG